MNVNSLITSVNKYFGSLAVGMVDGKVHLIEADDSGQPTKKIFYIDSTEEISFNYSKSVMHHPSEDKKVYMDGTRINPTSVSIRGYIEANSIPEFQKLIDDNRWFFLSVSKNIDGFANGVQVQTTPKKYVVVSSRILEEGFRNSVRIDIELREVVLFSYDIEYKYGIKQNNPDGGVNATKTSPSIYTPKPMDTLTRKSGAL